MIIPHQDPGYAPCRIGDEHVQHSTVVVPTIHYDAVLYGKVVAAVECGTPLIHHMPSLAVHTLSPSSKIE
jgi:hypothetical protein